MSEYSTRARQALAAADAKGLKVMSATRDRMMRLAAMNSHAEKDKQAIRALERRVKGAAAKPNRRNTPAKTVSSRRNNGAGPSLQDLPHHLFGNKIAPLLGARDLAALQRVSKNGKARVGNALQNNRFANQRNGQAPLVRRLRQVLASGLAKDPNMKKTTARKAFLELEKQGWNVNLPSSMPFVHGYGARGAGDAAWRQWYARIVIKTADNTSITITARHSSIAVGAGNDGKPMGSGYVSVGNDGWTHMYDTGYPLSTMIRDAIASAAKSEGIKFRYTFYYEPRY